MPFRVILLRNKGRRITRQEMLDSPPLEGLLVFEHVGTGACVRYHSSASLRLPNYAGATNVCKPLFEPTMERLDAEGLILKGHESETVDGALVQYVQLALRAHFVQRRCSGRLMTTSRPRAAAGRPAR